MCIRDRSSSEDDLDRKVAFIRSRSYSPGKESKTSTTAKPSLVVNDNKNPKNSVSFEKESGKNVVKVKAISQKDLQERNNVRNMNKTPKKTPKKKLLKSKKKRNESVGYNSETSSMMNSSLDDKNILDTIKSYLDSVKQNNYNEKREHSLQVISMSSFLIHNYLPQESPSKVIRIQSTRSSKLRAKSARQRLRVKQEFEELHIGPFY